MGCFLLWGETPKLSQDNQELFWGFWKLTMGVFGLAQLMECIVMMERPSRTLKMQPVRNNGYR